MSAPKFTPGPWRVWRDQDPKEPRMVTGPSSDFVCQICEENTQDTANAHLIAAAPALYAALSQFARMEIEKCERCNGSGEQPHAHQEACHTCGGTGEVVECTPEPELVRQARAALAIAEGGGK